MKLFYKIFTLLLLIICSHQIIAQTCPNTENVGIEDYNMSDLTVLWDSNPDASIYHISIERNGIPEVVNVPVAVQQAPGTVEFLYDISPAAFGPSDYLIIEIVTTCINGGTSTTVKAGTIASLVTVEEVYSGKDANNPDHEVCSKAYFHWVDDSDREVDDLGGRINKNTIFSNAGIYGGVNGLSISDFRWIKHWKYPQHEHLARLEECWEKESFTACLNPVYKLWKPVYNPNVCDENEGNGGGGRLSLLEATVSPNPISHSAALNFSLETKNEISVALYDLQGRMVKSFVNSQKFEAGPHFIQIERDNLSTGLYHLMISSNEINEMIKVIITK